MKNLHIEYFGFAAMAKKKEEEEEEDSASMLQTSAGVPEGGLRGTVHLLFTFLHLQQNKGQLPAGQGEIERLSPCCKFLFTW